MTKEEDPQNPNAKYSETGNSEANAALDQDMDAVVRALEEAKNKAEENWNLFLRARADVDNVRRRATQDVENAHKFGIERFVKELLAVVDSLEHGLLVAEKAGDNAYREGMELTLKLLLDTLDKFGVKTVDPKEGSFDPKLHEAIGMEPRTDIAPNTILVVAQKGFTLNERILRPARVIVSKAL